MFGYVKPHVPELKVCEYEMYRAVYCGLCRAMEEVTGLLSRLTLSYDFTFLAAVRMILTGETPVLTRRRCIAHPMMQRSMLEVNDSLRFTAAVAAVLGEAKIRDDLMDERGFSRVKPAVAKPFVGGMARRSLKLIDADAPRRIAEILSRLSLLERESSPSLDDTSDIFGEVMAYAFSLGLEGDSKKLAEDIGFSAGRYVYVADAADDVVEDVKKHRYNTIYAGWGDLSLLGGRLSPAVSVSLSISTPLMLQSLGEAVEKLDPAHPLTNIVKNIAYLGMPAQMERVLRGEKNKNERRDSL